MSQKWTESTGLAMLILFKHNSSFAMKSQIATSSETITCLTQNIKKQ